MARRPILKICKNCKKEFTTKESRSIFCSSSCSALFNNKNISVETRINRSKSLKLFWKLHPEKKSRGTKHSESVGVYTKGKFNKNPNNIYELSSSTRTKVLKRLKLKCSNCGWDKELCDLHHINGKQLADPNNHNNLSYLCPNCHRLAQRKIIEKHNLISFDKTLEGINWKNYYFG
jgi:predicted HNH restriction endonuclease